MITYSGIHIGRHWMSSPVPTPIDIAVGYGRMCRYAGALWVPNLAHVVLTAEIAATYGADGPTWSRSILHDAHEIVTGDAVAHFKGSQLKHLQEGLDTKIFGYYLGRDDGMSETVDVADLAARDAEALELGLPGYAAHTLAEEDRIVGEVPLLYREWVRELNSSEWVQNTTHPNCMPVSCMEEVITHIRDGHYRIARQHLHDYLPDDMAATLKVWEAHA